MGVGARPAGYRKSISETTDLLGFLLKNGAKKHQKTSSDLWVENNSLLMREVRGEWPGSS